MSPTPTPRLRSRHLHSHRARLKRTSAVAAGLALAASLLGPAALADPVTQDDIDRSKAAENSTSSSIAELESQLAQLSVDSDNANLNAQVANEDYLEAKADLDTATAEADEAQNNADDAAAAVVEARAQLGSVVVQTYQEGGNALDALRPYLTSESLADLSDADVALTRAGEKSDAHMQKVEALQAVADTMQSIADDKRAAKQVAADAATEAKANADSAAAAASASLSYAQTQRQSLITQLAAQRNTTVELETQYQEQLEAARRAAEEQAAREAAEEAARQAAAEEAARQAAEQAAAEEAARQAAEQANTPSYTPPAPSYDPPAPSYSSGSGAAAVNAAMSYLGTPYVWGGESYGGVDCSGLVMLAYGAVGVNLYHSSRVQYGQGMKVPLSAAEPGDLLFWSENGSQSGIYHVAMYVGNGQMIEAPTFGMVVRVTGVRYGGIMPYAVRP